MAGVEVNRQMLDLKMSQALLDLREAYDKVRIVAKWLANHPAPGADPIQDAPFDYTVDEAYAIRLVFETLETSRVNLASTFDVATQLTGLE